MKLTIVAMITVPVFASGCLASGYAIRHDELVRLAQLPPEQRGDAVRVTQLAFRGDMPASHLFSGGGSFSVGNLGGSGDGALVLVAVVAACAAVAVASAIVAVAGAEATRFDGWVRLQSDTPIDLSGPSSPGTVALSELSADHAAVATEGFITAGVASQLHRAPLDRNGFGGSLAALASGFPLANGLLPVAAGGRATFGYNIRNFVGLALAGDFLGLAPDATHGAFVLTFGPEISVFPVRYFGLYVGAGAAYRETNLAGLAVAASRGSFERIGLESAIPITTRFALQLRAGVTRFDLGDLVRPIVLDSSLGFALF